MDGVTAVAERGDSNGDGDAHLFAPIGRCDGDFRDLSPDAFGSVACLFEVGTGEQDDELLAAEPADKVARTQAFSQPGRHTSKHVVTGEVAVPV